MVAQLLHRHIKWHGAQTISEGNLTLSGIDQHAPIGFDVCSGKMKAARHFGGGSPLDLDCPSLTAGKAKDKVKFGTSRCPIKEGFSAYRCCGDQGFKAESLPTATDHGMAQQAFQRTKTEQRMQQAAVADIDLW